MSADIQLLYVDKSRTAHRLFEKAVSQVAYVTCVTSVEEALDAVAKTPFNFIVSDYELPDGDGIALARRLRKTKSYAQTPMLLYTAGLNNDMAYQAMKAGYHDSLQKPMDMMGLTERIVSLVEVPEVKRVQRQLVQISCVSWSDVDGMYHEYSPDLNRHIRGHSSDVVREAMAQHLDQYMIGDEAEQEMPDPVETRLVKHVVQFDQAA